jgi:hypothetical protein
VSSQVLLVPQVDGCARKPREVGDVIRPVLLQLLHLDPLTTEQVGAHREHVVLALKSILQPVQTHGQPTKVLPDVQQLLTGVHMRPLGLQQDGGRAVEALLELANTEA